MAAVTIVTCSQYIHGCIFKPFVTDFLRISPIDLNYQIQMFHSPVCVCIDMVCICAIPWKYETSTVTPGVDPGFL